ncbi:MAG: two-component sensor histidine kinase [Deltaproteobacteria bacterium]|nr:MAG: two-component sensor histidine kinase [Deltaproteobacteria bacterium]
MVKKKIVGPHYYRTLKRNMLLIMILVSFAPLLLIAGIILYQFQVSHQEKVIAHLEEVVEKHRQNIDGFLDEKLADIRVMTRTFSLEQFRDESFLQGKLAILQEEHGGVFVDLGLVNGEGLQVAYAGAFKLARVNYSEADWFKKALKSEQFISDVFLGIRGLPHFIVAVKKEWQGSNWILRSTIDFVAFNSLVENLRIGKTGIAFIVNREGEFQTNAPLAARPKSKEHVDLLSKSLPQGLTPEDQDQLEGTDRLRKKKNDHHPVTLIESDPQKGGKYISVSTPLKNGEWLLIYQQDTADAFADLYRARKLALVIFLVGGLGIVSMAFILSKRIIKHIVWADREKEMMNEQIIEAGKLASVGELAAGIAHEINNPVAIMVEEAGWIEDLLEEDGSCEDPAEARRALKQIKNQGVRCKQITHKLLSFARKTDPELRKVQLNELIDEVVALSEQRVKYSNVKLKLNLTPHLPEVYASPSEFEQVLLNLVNNALDAMTPEGGTLEITTRVDGGHVVVDVADTGQGIPKANLARIFDPFFTTKPVGKGTGLGLSICYGIIKKMEGEISVNSAVGLGTTFHVRLPLSPEDLAKKDLPHERLAVHLGGGDSA